MPEMPCPVSCHLFVHISVLRLLVDLESFLSSVIEVPNLRLLGFHPRGTYQTSLVFFRTEEAQSVVRA